TGEGSISARMRVRIEKDALRRSRIGVRTDADPFLLHLLANVPLRHEEVHGPDPAAVLYHQVDRRFLRRGSALLGDFGKRLAGQALQVRVFETDDDGLVRAGV